MEQRKTIGAWKKQTSKGEVISFVINGQKYSMWVNGRKTKDSHPDFNIIEDNYKKENTPPKAPNQDQLEGFPF